MTKTTHSWRIKEETVIQFKQFVLNKYGKLHGVLGEEVQNALVSWMGNQGLVAHTKTHINPGMPRAQAKIDQIIKWLRNQGYSNQFVSTAWDQACICTVGSDQRTIDKYLHLAKKLGRIKHYAGAVWEIV